MASSSISAARGMSERGLGGRPVPDYTCMITEWVKEVATIPIMVKLTPNVSDVTSIGRGPCAGPTRSHSSIPLTRLWVSI